MEWEPWSSEAGSGGLGDQGERDSRMALGFLAGAWRGCGGIYEGETGKGGGSGETMSLVRWESIGQNLEESLRLECPCHGGRDGMGKGQRGEV